MNCREAQQIIDLVPARRLQEGSGACAPGAPERNEWVEFQEHIRECGLCRVAYDASRVEDARLRGSLVDVPIPEGLEERLQAALDQSDLAATVSGRWRRAGGRLAALAAMCLLAVSTLIWWIGGRVSLEQVRQRVNAQVLESPRQFDDLPTVESMAGLVPGWEWRALVRDEPGRGLDLDSRPGLDACIFRFVDHATRVQGYLVVLPRRLLNSPPANVLPSGIQYLPLPSSVWVSGEHVYLCVAQQGDLSRLLRSLYGTSA